MDRNVKRTKKIFELIEKDYNLFEMKIGNTQIWQYIRLLVFSAIQGKKPLKNSHSWHYWLKKIFVLLKYSFSKNAIIGKKKKILVFNHPRRKIIDGQYWAIYTDFLIKSGGLGSNYQVIELDNEGRKPAMIKETKMLDFAQNIAFLYRIFIKIRFSERELKKLKQLQNRIKNDFSIELNIVSLVKKKIREIGSYFWILNKILDIYQPKLIIEVVYYNRILMALNDLCKTRNIPTIEFQHGQIGQLDIAYDFPPNIKVDVFPDYIFTFGIFSGEKTNFPINKNKIIAVGFPYLEMESKKYLKKSNSNLILFISQWTIGEKLSQLALKFAKISNYEVIYKLHPREYSSWENDYPWLKTKEIKVIDNDEIPIYQLFSESYAIVGVYSTALFEGLMYGLKIFIVNLPGYDYMEDLIKMGYVTLISNPTELNEKLEELNSSNAKKIDSNYFLKSNSIENQRKEIHKILNKVNSKH